MVTMWQGRVAFTESMIAASVDVRPEPASPATRTNPAGASASFAAADGSPSASSEGTPGTTRRKTMPMRPR